MEATYIVIPAILLFVVLAAITLDRLSVPVILVALCSGLLFGSDMLNLWSFHNMELANHVANFALVFILFHGGFGVKKSDFRAVALPAGGMATWGVLLTAAVTFLVLWKGLRWPVEMAALLSVIISSTDAAATLSILRRQSLPSKLSSTLEIESAANDPMAVLLTVVVVETLSPETAGRGISIIPLFIWKFTIGPLIGYLIARISLLLFNRLRPQERGHYYVLFVALVLLTYGLTEALQASGMLAVFIMGFIMGNHSFVYKQGVSHFSSAFSSLANICMFVLLGLLAAPSEFLSIGKDGVLLFLVLTFIARPVALLIGTIGMRLGWRNLLFMAWAGLRGAVPIVLATYPAAAGLPQGQLVFNLIFIAVILSILLQGSTLGVVAKWLKLSMPPRHKPLYSLELITMAQSDMDLIVVDLPEPIGKTGPRIQDIHLPPGTIITLITRGPTVVSPNGGTVLKGGDQLTILSNVQNEEEIRTALLTPFEAAPAPA